MTSTENISNEYLESLQTPESWADALLEHGSGTLVALFSDQSVLKINNEKLITQHIPPTDRGLQLINLVNNCDISVEKMGEIQGQLSLQTDQHYYARSHLVKKPPYPKDRYFLTFSDTIASLPPGFMAMQYEQPMDLASNPGYDNRSGGTIRELFVVPTRLGKKLIQTSLKDPTHIERVMQAMLPGLTQDRQRPKVGKLELIEGSDMGAIIRGTKVLGGVSNRQVIELSTPIGEVEPVPKLLPQAIKIINANLAYSPDLSEKHADSGGDRVDPRDLTSFIGEDRMLYADQPMETSMRFSHYSDRNDSKYLDASVQYTHLTHPDKESVPFGRLHLALSDKKLLTDGQIRVDFRRLGDDYVLDLGVAKGNFQQNVEHYRGNMKSLDVTYGELPPILKQLSEQLGSSPGNEFLLEGLRQILATMKR